MQERFVFINKVNRPTLTKEMFIMHSSTPIKIINNAVQPQSNLMKNNR